MRLRLPRLPQLILLNGPKLSGKDTLAMSLRDLDPENIGIEQLAEPIKDATIALHFQSRFADIDLDDPVFKAQEIYPNVTVRQLIIDVGTLAHSYDPQFLGKELLRRLDSTFEAFRTIVVPDCRLLNNVLPLFELPITRLLVRLFRPGTTWENDVGSHFEIPMDLRDAIVELPLTNDTTPLELLARFLEAIERLDFDTTARTACLHRQQHDKYFS